MTGDWWLPVPVLLIRRGVIHAGNELYSYRRAPHGGLPQKHAWEDCSRKFLINIAVRQSRLNAKLGRKHFPPNYMTTSCIDRIPRAGVWLFLVSNSPLKFYASDLYQTWTRNILSSHNASNKCESREFVTAHDFYSNYPRIAFFACRHSRSTPEIWISRIFQVDYAREICFKTVSMLWVVTPVVKLDMYFISVSRIFPLALLSAGIQRHWDQTYKKLDGVSNVFGWYRLLGR